jgi:uncharacterized protein
MDVEMARSTSRSDLQPLKALLSGPKRPAGAMSYHELQGFLFTIAAAPEMVMPSEFLPLVWGDREPDFADGVEAQAIIGGILFSFNEISAGMSDGGTGLPDDCRFRDDLMANLELDAPVSQWSRGFSRGHLWLKESWDAHLPDEPGDELAMMMLTLSFFSSWRMAEKLLETSTDGSQTLEKMAETMRSAFLPALAAYAHLGRTIHQALMKGQAQPAERKVGRNAPCPCGSGKKYKRCCGSLD